MYEAGLALARGWGRVRGPVERTVLGKFLTVFFPPGNIVEFYPHSRRNSPVRGELNEDPKSGIFQHPVLQAASGHLTAQDG